MNKVIFPKNTGQRYYHSHFRFFLQLARAAGKKVESRDLREDGRGFYFVYRGQKALVDFGDHRHIGENVDNYPINFRYHYCENTHKALPNCRPLTPISFYDWMRYERLKNLIEYKADRDFVLNNQTAGKAAKDRREKVQVLLKTAYGTKADFEITDKVLFWRKANSCLVSVCVPGARNDILDRGQFQFWAFGACTISPPLDIKLPFWRGAEPGIHYIACQPNYEDLIDKIEYCKTHRTECVQIGRAAKKLFQETSTPKKVWEWIDQSMEELGL